MKSMRSIWFTSQDDVELRTGSTPIDWLPFQAEKILNSEFILREIRDTPSDLEGTAEVMRPGFPAI